MDTDPEKYYDEFGIGEWERSEELFTHSIEHENTYPYLEKHLPDEGHILDAGGAAGRYTVWLAENGYDVTLVDISEEQLRIAEEKLEERGLKEQVKIQKGDIRDLDFEDESFDAVLCLGGPLSHVIDNDGRETAAGELVRVAKKDHPVFVSVMGFYAALMVQVLNEWGFVWKIEDFHERQKYDQEFLEKDGSDPEFAHTYFFKPGQLEDLMQRNGLEIDKMIGLENVVSVMDSRKEDGELDVNEAYKQRLRKTARLLRGDDAAPALSSHILAIGWK